MNSKIKVELKYFHQTKKTKNENHMCIAYAFKRDIKLQNMLQDMGT